MALFNSTHDSRAAFLYKCIHKSKSEQNVWEELGLYSQTNERGKDPDFHLDEVNKLRSKMKEIAQSFAASRSEGRETIQDDLTNQNLFSNEIDHLLEQYGQAIWGKQVGHSRSFKPPERTGDELEWDKREDKTSIRFLVHCWIARLVVTDAIATPRKKGAKSKKIDLSQDAVTDNDSSSSEDVPAYRAPEPNMHPGLANIPNWGNASRQKSNGQDRVSDHHKGFDKATDSPSRRPNPQSHNKRKSGEIPGQHIGKLQKVSKEPRPVPYRPHQDPYAIPESPTPSVSTAPASNLFQRQRQRETTADSDATYVPTPSVRAETETVDDENEVMADHIDLIFNPSATNNDGLQNEHLAQPTAGPSGTYNLHRRQDSVIPDTQNEATQALLQSFRLPNASNSCNNTELQHREQTPTVVMNSDEVYTKFKRNELFSLLLSFLNGINEFENKSYNPDAERRMDELIDELFANDKEELHKRLGNEFERLHRALLNWINMRNRLKHFRLVTNYGGLPGSEWKAHLRGMNDARSRAQACIAFNNMKAIELEDPSMFTDAFDEDLAQIFDLLTKVKGCNGAEEFKAIQAYNGTLSEWIKEEESQD